MTCIKHISGPVAQPERSRDNQPSNMALWKLYILFMNRKGFSGRFEPTRQHLTQLCPGILKSHASPVTNVNWAVFMAPWHIKPTAICFLSSEDRSRCLIPANELVHVRCP